VTDRTRTTPTHPADSHPAASGPALPLPAWAGIGLAAAVLGLLPWIVTGMRLPLQYLWASDTLPGDMPIVLLPFSQYALTLLVGLVVLAYAAAGIVARAAASRRGRFAMLVLSGTIAGLHLIAIVQTAVVVAGGLTDRTVSTLYVAALVAVVVVAVLIGVVLFRAIAVGSRAAAVVAFAVAALAAGFWLSGLLAPLGRLPSEFQLLLLPLADRIPAVLVGAAIVWGGIRSAGRIIAAVGALAILWIGPALATAISAAVGSRVLLPYPLEMLDYGWAVFRQALVLPELVLPRLIIALVVAAVGLAVRELLARRATVPPATP
jgi:hypothetical protein